MTAWIAVCLYWLAHQLYPTTPAPDVAELAAAIDEAAHAHPLEGDDGVPRMAAELVALAMFEGHGERFAVATDAWGRSCSYFQVHETNARRLGVSDLFDPGSTADAAARLVLESHALCGDGPGALAEYASGRARCDVPEGVAASRVRMRFAAALLRTHPPFWTELTRAILR